jgi:hypothetical protein
MQSLPDHTSHDPLDHPKDRPPDPARTARTRDIGLAVALVVAPWFIVVANTADSITSMDGADDLTPRGALALAAAHPTLEGWANLAGLLGSLLLVPAVIGIMKLVRLRAARLGLIGGVLTGSAYICYFALIFGGFTPAAMVAAGGSKPQNIAVLQALLDEPKTIWVYVLFAVGNIVGTFLLGLALLRARTVPAWAAYAVIAWPVLHVLGLPWFEVIGAVLQAVGMLGVAMALLRRTVADPVVETASYELLRK